MFLNDFGHIIAPSQTVFPPDLVEDAEDLAKIRYCVRHNVNENTGFVFINNHQRLRRMEQHENVNISIEMPGETIKLPAMNIPTDFYGLFPYNIKLGETLLKSTNAQLLCKAGEQYVFFCHENPIFNFVGDQPPMIALNEKEADNAWLIDDKLYVTEGDLVTKDGDIYLTTCKTEEIVISYPKKEVSAFNFTPVTVDASFTEVFRDEKHAEYKIQLGDIPASIINDLFLCIDFAGDRAELYIDKKLSADWFTTGLPWRIGLRRFNYKTVFTLKVYPITQETYFECETDDSYVLENVSTEAQYAAWI
jgi:hypothetical protein